MTSKRALDVDDDDVIVLTDTDSDDLDFVPPKAPTPDNAKPVLKHPLPRTHRNPAPKRVHTNPATLLPISGPAPSTVLLDATNTSPTHALASSSALNPSPAPLDPLDVFVNLILEVVPDLDPQHARELVDKHHLSFGKHVVQNVLHVLFEDPSYPKLATNKLKRKQQSDDAQGPSKKQHIDYSNAERQYNGGPDYVELAMKQLFTDFPFIPKPHVRAVFFQLNNFYAPTHLCLLEQSKQANPPFKRKATSKRAAAKGKGKLAHDEEYERERAWLRAKLECADASENEQSQASTDQAADDCVDGIECGCCFAPYPFDKMVQCPDAHLFCTKCMTSYVSNLLGQHDPKIPCMDQSGCKLLIPESELNRFLEPKLLSLYYRVKQNKEIESAGLDGLEECPFCEYKVVIDNPDEKLFRCENDECAAVTCRQCKKTDHLPKTCKEMEEDQHINARHAIEEAMTEALTRKCPRCQKPFVKEMGCNKMTCPHCQTVSCYICRKVINGYDHFQAEGRIPGTTGPTKKCALWDSVEQRHDEEVAAARQKATEDFRRENPDIDEAHLVVELPKTAPVAPGPAVEQGLFGGGGAIMAAALRRGAGLMHHLHAPFAVAPAVLAPPPAPMWQVNVNINGHNVLQLAQGGVAQAQQQQVLVAAGQERQVAHMRAQQELHAGWLRLEQQRHDLQQRAHQHPRLAGEGLQDDAVQQAALFRAQQQAAQQQQQEALGQQVVGRQRHRNRQVAVQRAIPVQLAAVRQAGRRRR